MPCIPFTLPNGARGIACTGRQRPKLCPCGSGRRAVFLCDWKDPSKPTGTCDALVCEACTTKPAPDKDLCPDHAKAWTAWQQTRKATR